MRWLKSINFTTATPWLALAGVFMVLSLGLSMAVYEEHLYQSQRLREVHGEAEILAASMTAALVFHDRQAAQEYVDPMRANPDLDAAGVYDNAGHLVVGFSRRGHSPLPARVQSGEVMQSADRLTVTVPVIQDNLEIGTVYVRAIAEPLAARLARYAVLALLAVMSVLVVAVLVGSQVALARANGTLERQAHALAATNDRLQAEILEREQVEEALRQSQKMEAIGQLSGGIAHDFNNLLMIIKGNLNFLRKKPDHDPAAAAGRIAAAIEGADRAAALTRRLLAFSRKQPLFPEQLDLNSLIVSLRELIRSSSGEKIEISQNLGASWPVVCDANQMENVVLNLVLNARDAMPGGGVLTLRTADIRLSAPAARAFDVPPGDYVELTVRDNGTGMSEDVRSRAVDPFFTTKPVGQGTGLGLSAAVGFIRQSNGAMQIASTPGEGTTVQIVLPRAAEALTAQDVDRNEART